MECVVDRKNQHIIYHTRIASSWTDTLAYALSFNASGLKIKNFLPHWTQDLKRVRKLKKNIFQYTRSKNYKYGM